MLQGPYGENQIPTYLTRDRGMKRQSPVYATLLGHWAPAGLVVGAEGGDPSAGEAESASANTVPALATYLTEYLNQNWYNEDNVIKNIYCTK